MKNIQISKEFYNQSDLILQKSIRITSKEVRGKMRENGIFKNENKKSVFWELLYALQMNLSTVIVHILLFGATLDDIKNLVIYSTKNKWKIL